jgi:hypothetical protein
MTTANAIGVHRERFWPCAARSRLLAALVLATTLAGIAGSAHASGIVGPAKCTAAKAKAVGKNEAAQLACYEKAAATAGEVATSCLTRANGKLAAAIAKADTEGLCPGAVSDLQVPIDRFINYVIAIVPGTGDCPMLKLKATGGFSAAAFGCYGKDSVKAGFDLGGCIRKAVDSFTRAFANAPVCTGNGSTAGVDASELGIVVLGEVGDIAMLFSSPSPTSTTHPGGATTTTTLPTLLRCCQRSDAFGRPACSVLTPDECAATNGVTSPAGDVCGGNGSCGPSPGIPGDCCDSVTDMEGNAICASVSASSCAWFVGTYHEYSVCGPSGACKAGPPPSGVCCQDIPSFIPTCGSAPTAESCLAAHGFPAASGTVCDATGCNFPPGVPAGCCEVSINGDTACRERVGFDDCQAEGGYFAAGTVCDPSGHCLPPACTRKGLNDQCSGFDECCTGACTGSPGSPGFCCADHGGACRSFGDCCNTGDRCENGACCAASKQSCFGSDECCEGWVCDITLKLCCLPHGAPCSAGGGSDCCGGICVGGPTGTCS